MKQAGFWARVGHWFKSTGQGDWGQGRVRLPRDDSTGIPASEASPQQPNDDGAGTVLQPLSRRRQREQTLDTLQEGFAKLVGLIDEIYQHLGRQDRRAEQIAEALTELADTTARLPEAAQEQSKQLGTIAAQLEAGNDRSRRWESAVRDLELPRLAQAQRQALDAIGQKLEGTGRLKGTCWRHSTAWARRSVPGRRPRRPPRRCYRACRRPPPSAMNT